MKYIALILIVAFTACSNDPLMVNEKDFSNSMRSGHTKVAAQKLITEMAFWENRLNKDTGNFVDMLEIAKCRLTLFKLTGNTADLHKGDSLLNESSAKLRNTNPGILYSLSQASITQHKFKFAADFNESARKADADHYTISLLDFDVSMELGRYKNALKDLNAIMDKHSFDYLIRRAKWEDHHGDLNGAIKLMEEAFEDVKESKKSLFIWTLSNLSDMYGHAGRIKDAYNGYISVLRKDPDNLYCLKGLAWIAYSHDHNYTLAKKLLNFIQSETSMPDLELMLADINESEGNIRAKEAHIKNFISTVSGPYFGNMYNKYLINIYAAQPSETKKAVELAEKEILNRFTPETCRR